MSIKVVDPLRGTEKYRYTNVNQNILQDQRLGLRERGLLVTILSFPENWKYSAQGLSTIIPDGVKSIRSAMSILEDFGYIERENTHNRCGQYDGQALVVYPNCRPSVPKGETAKGEMGKGETAKRKPWKRQELKTNELMTDESITQQSITQSSIESVVEGVKAQISYDSVCIDMPAYTFILDALVDSMASVYLNPKRQYIIKGEAIDGIQIIQRLKRLTIIQVEYVVKSIAKSQKTIKNAEGYIITALYNAERDADLEAMVIANQISGG